MFSTRAFLRPSVSVIRSFSTSAARAMAKVTIIGRLGADPEMVTSSGGREYMKYTVASYHKSGGEEKISWFRVAAFEPYQKEYLLSLKKGTLVYLEGNLKTSTYEVEGKSVVSYDISQRQINVLSLPKPAPAEEEES